MPDFRFLKAHKVNRVQYAEGEIQAFDERIGEWLAEQGYVARTEQQQPPSAPVVAPQKVAPKFVSTPRFKCCGW